MSQRFPYCGAASAASPYYVMLATPVAEKPCTSYAVSLAGTAQALTVAGIRFDIETLQGCCHVDDARNILFRNFLQSECTDLFFLDADLGWQPNNVIRLLKLPGDIVAGVYPHKSDTETYPFHAFEGESRANEFGLFEMPKVATGFMRIRREVIAALYEREKTKERLMWLDGDSAQLNKLPVARICERGFVRELGLEHLSRTHASQSGDYVLCLKARSLGYRVWADPDMRFNHSGDKTWHGHFGNHTRKLQGRWQQKFIDAVANLRCGEASEETIEQLSASYGVEGWPLSSEALFELYHIARATCGDVVETGSGLSTLVLGLALAGSDRYVHAIEHDAQYWRFTARMLAAFDIPNVMLHYAPLVPEEDGSTYDFSAMQLPLTQFGLALIDGPPARYEGRGKAAKYLAPLLSSAVVIVDDIEGVPDVLEQLAGHDIERRPGQRQWAIARPRYPQPMREAAE